MPFANRDIKNTDMENGNEALQLSINKFLEMLGRFKELR